MLYGPKREQTLFMGMTTRLFMLESRMLLQHMCTINIQKQVALGQGIRGRKGLRKCKNVLALDQKNNCFRLKGVCVGGIGVQ